MEKYVFDSPEQMGKEAAKRAAACINQAVSEKGNARLLLSTGLSQFEFFNNIIHEDIDWSRVEVFHLDEYVGISEEHRASFVKYIKERLVNQVHPKKTYFVDSTGDIAENIKYLTEELNREPIDLGMIGIGENAHVAFNDPPADFDTKESYIVVQLDEKCRLQQVGEGWFESLEQVPEKAVSMTVPQVMKCQRIISCVPHKEKAQAVKDTLEMDVTPDVPASILKTHPSWVLLLDKASASLL